MTEDKCNHKVGMKTTMFFYKWDENREYRLLKCSVCDIEKSEAIFSNVKGYKPKRKVWDSDDHECITCHMSRTSHARLPFLTCEDFK